MRTSFFLLLLFVLLSSQAQRAGATDPRFISLASTKIHEQSNKALLAKAKKGFIRDFGSLAVQRWQTQEGFFVATFICAGGVLDAYYTSQGKLSGLSRQVHPLELPEDARAFIARKYKGYAAVKVVRFTAQKSYRGDVPLFGGRFPAANASFVELAKKETKLVLKINDNGDIHFFKEL